MTPTIRIAIAGVGNCASALLQGLTYYRNVTDTHVPVPGLMHNVIGPYKIADIHPVAAFDVDSRKVGKKLADACFRNPNCTLKFSNITDYDVQVMMGPIHDGIATHMKEYPDHQTFLPSDAEPVDISQVLRDTKADLLINYMPVGSQKATETYAQACLDANVAFLNCMPVFIASNASWAQKFTDANIPLAGDDIKSQIGATILHRTLTDLFMRRGVTLERTYQLNTGGNTDFLNMLSRSRLSSKKISKTEAVISQLTHTIHPDNIHIGPSDYVPWQKDNKVCFLRMEGKKFGDVPVTIELRLSVEDSPNSAGCVIDGIRCLKLAKDRNLAGPIHAISSAIMKHPPKQITDTDAFTQVNAFINQPK